MRRRRKLLSIALLCMLALTGIALCRQIIAQKAVEAVFAQTTGFPIEIGSVQINPWHSRFAAEDIRLFNPSEFGERLFADIPRLYVEYQFRSFLRGPPHLTRADLHIRQLVIVKDSDGHSNIRQLRGLGAGPDAAPPPFHIDTLHLRIGSVTTKDYRGSRLDGRTRELNMAITFRDVTERTDINRRIFFAVLRRIWFGRADPANGIDEPMLAASEASY
jgi:hypothetical protein